MVLEFPCAGFLSEKGFHRDVENLGSGFSLPKKVYRSE